MANIAAVAQASGATGGATGYTILLNMFLKRHGHESLQPEEAMAVVAVIAPIFHALIIISTAVVQAILKKFGISISEPDQSSQPTQPTGV